MQSCHSAKGLGTSTHLPQNEPQPFPPFSSLPPFCVVPLIVNAQAKTIPKSRLLSENEWRSIGVQQSKGWQHYALHRPEPHILLFRRPLGTNPTTGKVDPSLIETAKEEYQHQFGLRHNAVM